ncbi:hypothetical protein NC652_020824 [Populus alba x Populus x berolinensis]|nr:hypothetical protein NC652_020824 [Populus alba x Populus x berolinensis]
MSSPMNRSKSLLQQVSEHIKLAFSYVSHYHINRGGRPEHIRWEESVDVLVAAVKDIAKKDSEDLEERRGCEVGGGGETAEEVTEWIIHEER